MFLFHQSRVEQTRSSLVGLTVLESLCLQTPSTLRSPRQVGWILRLFTAVGGC